MDLIAHLKSHAVHFKQYSDEKITKKNLHFTFSIEDLQFINRDQDEIMMQLFNRLKDKNKILEAELEDYRSSKITIMGSKLPWT